MVAVVATLSFAPVGSASPGLAVGAVENELLWNTAQTVSVARHLGLRTMVVNLEWEPRLNDLEQGQIDALNRVVTTAGGVRIVLGVHNNWMRTPVDEPGRQRYCEFAANALRRYPQINDIIVWNEPNLGFFWRPQFDADGASEAPRAYFQLAAHCYDVLHGVRPGANVVGPVNSHWGNDNPNGFSNVSHSPPRFIRELGAAYRASGRQRPLFDTLGHHPYPLRSDEHPSVRHTDPAVISIGDTSRLLEVMQEAFGGTGQRIPQDGLPIWYLETGYQTTVPESKRDAYDQDRENWPGPVPDAGSGIDQAKQLTDSLRLMYCQPHVEAMFNFLLKDERPLAGWQSGVFWADGSPKGSFEAYRSAIREVNEGRVDCGTVPGAGAPPVTQGTARTPSAGAGAVDPSKPAAQRAVTTLTYSGATRARLGRLLLRADLTRGATKSANGLAARQVTFKVGDETYLTATDARGIASLRPLPLIAPGRHRVEVRFRGDELSLGSVARAEVRVVNTRGRVTTRAWLPLSATLRARVDARSNGTSAQGTLRLRGLRPSRVRLEALSVLGKGRFAWLSGTERGTRWDVQLRRLARGSQVQIWRNGVALHRAATVPSRLLRIRG